MIAPLTEELIYRLAPDSKSTVSALELIKGGALGQLRQSPDGTWLDGTCRGSGPEPYTVRVDLSDERLLTACNCESRKRPCKHALALLFLALRQPERFVREEPPLGQRGLLLGTGTATAPKLSGAPAEPANVGEALFQSICAEPLDDGPRLIYADWLEEQGDSDRAEYIRLQCQLAHLAGDDPQAPELRQREKALWKKYRSEWLSDFPRSARKACTPFERGFPAGCLRLGSAALLKHRANLFQRAPIHSVQVTTLLTATDAARLAVCPFLGRLRSLELSGCLARAPGTLKALLATPVLSSLVELHLGGNELGAPGMRALAPWPHLAWLQRLGLQGNVLQDGGLTALLAAPDLSGLRALNLDSNWIESAGASALAGATHLSGLRELVLANNGIGPKGAKALALSPLLRQLTVLDLSNNSIGDTGAKALLASLPLGPISRLDLRRNDFRGPVRADLRDYFGERVLLGDID
jgi:uncharacterized protein (TIGR02996 family)